MGCFPPSPAPGGRSIFPQAEPSGAESSFGRGEAHSAGVGAGQGGAGDGKVLTTSGADSVHFLEERELLCGPIPQVKRLGPKRGHAARMSRSACGCLLFLVFSPSGMSAP